MTLLKEETQEINEKIREMYVFNANLEEDNVKKQRKKLYKEVVGAYESWDKALQVNGITKRKIREREKFLLYYMLKQRYEKYGVEAIRPKNVQPQEIKDRIVNSFKTLKALKDIVSNWNEDKVLYELHAALLTGATISNLEKEESELYEQMMDHFKDLNHALEQYNKRFGIPSIAPEQMLHSVEEDDEDDDIDVHVLHTKTDDLIDMMIKLQYIDSEEDAEAITKANHIKKDDVISFLFNALADAQVSGQKITEEGIKKKNAAVYFAIKAHYRNLENAFKEITKSLVEVK